MAFCCDKLSLYTTNTKKFRVDYYETRERERERERESLSGITCRMEED